MKASRHIFTKILTASLAIVPFLAYAQLEPAKLGNLISKINSKIVAEAGTLFIALGVVAFFYGMAQFIFASRNGVEAEIKKGKDFMLWSVLSLFVIFSIYGIILFGQDIFGFTGKTDIILPRILLNGSVGNSDPNTPSPLPSVINNPPYYGTGAQEAAEAAQACSGSFAGRTCDAGNGQSGVCVQGGPSRGYALYCSTGSTNECSGKADNVPCSNNSGSCKSGSCDTSRGSAAGCSGSQVRNYRGICVDQGASCRDFDGTSGFYDASGNCAYN